MRLLEIVILLLSLIALIANYLPARQQMRWLKFLSAMIIIVTLVHLVVEQYRWQMILSYGLTVVLFLLSLPSLLKSTERSRRHGALSSVAGVFGFAWWLIAAALPIYLMPVPQLPAPPGPYQIGSVVFDWTDTSRPETYTPDPGDKRELMVQFWYPAQPAADAKTIPVIDHVEVAYPALAKVIGFPAFALDHLRLVRTHSYADAPIRADGAPYPVIIYSTGYTGYRTAAFNQMEALASSGYIVASIDHPFGSAFTVFSDGHVALNYPDVLPSGDLPATTALESTYVADERFVLDQLQRLNAGELDVRFAGKLDLQRIGLTGHSTGAGAIVWTCHIDTRCKAALAQDGWYEPIPSDVLSTPLHHPIMLMQSETTMWQRDNLKRLADLYQTARADAYQLKLTGVQHLDFSDYPLFGPHSLLLSNRGTLEGA